MGGDYAQAGGLFGAILGPSGLGLSGKTETGSQRTQLDQPTLMMNDVLLNNLVGGTGAAGGLAGLINTLKDTANLSPETQNFLQSIMSRSQAPGLDPAEWYRQSQALTDPTASIGAAQNVLRDIVSPELQGQYSLMGMGRSGAFEEALGKAGEQLALPIAQQAQQERVALAQQYPGVDTQLRQAGLERLGQGMQASDYGRQQQQAIYSNLLAQFVRYLMGNNFTPAPTRYTQGVGNEGLLDTAFGAGMGQAAGKMLSI